MGLLQSLKELIRSGAAKALPVDSSVLEDKVFKAVLKNSSVAIVVTDAMQPNKPILFANPAYKDITGYAPEEVVGRNPRYLQGPLTDPAHIRALHDAVAEGKPCRLELINYHKDGHPFWNEVAIDPIRDESGEIRYWLALKTDVNKRKEAEEALKKAVAELERSNQELDSFAHTVSHDLKNPIGAINGFAKLLMGSQGDKLSPDGKELLQSVINSSTRMKELVEDILLFAESSRAEIHREKVDLSAIAQTASENLQKTDPQRKVAWGIAQGLVVQGDPKYLRFALENLFSNAWKYSGKKAETIIEFGVKEEGGEKVFYVKDNGAGFDQANAKTLFQPFARFHAKSDFQGSGVGLSTVARVLEKHGGRIWADSKPGEGATFFFTVPTPTT
jgi:PAS domain S-box-containing protein